VGAYIGKFGTCSLTMLYRLQRMVARKSNMEVGLIIGLGIEVLQDLSWRLAFKW
jgi:hypothetical protein